MKNIFFKISLFFVAYVCQIEASPLPDFPFVYADGEATVQVAPEIATVSFEVEAFDPEPANAVTIVRDRSTELVAFFTEHGIKKEDVVAYEINKNSVRETKDYVSLNIIGYSVNRRFEIKIDDLKQYESFVKRLFLINNVVRINSRFDRENREEIKADLIMKACNDAKNKAQLMAQGFGVKLGPIFAISQVGFESIGNHFSVENYRGVLALPVEDASSEILFVPSTINFNKRVNAIFKLQIEK